MKTQVSWLASSILLVGLFSFDPTAIAQITQPQSGTAAPPSAKELPWKPVAAPQGILSLENYAEKIKTFGDRTKFADNKKFVEKLLDETVRAIPSPILQQKDLVYAIHVVELGDLVKSGDPSNPSAEVKVKSNAWYLYHKKVTFEEFIGERIYGSHNVVVLFLHINAKGVLASRLTERNCAPLADTKDPTLMCNALEQQSNDQNSAFLANGTLVDPANGLRLRPLGDGAVDSAYADIHYEAAVVRKVPANIQNLLSILKILGIVSQAAQTGLRRVPTQKVIMWGSGAISDMTVPSDIHIAGYAGNIETPVVAGARDSSRIGSEAALDNEGRYWWDASIGIPVHKIKEVQYSSSDNTIVAKQVDKQSAYAMFNLMLWPVDLKDPKSNLMPRILLGFPLASDPWDRLFAGGGFGLPKIMVGSQFFFGAVFDRVSKPQTLGAGSPGTLAQLINDSRLQREKKLMIGINVPVKSVFDKLK